MRVAGGVITLTLLICITLSRSYTIPNDVVTSDHWPWQVASQEELRLSNRKVFAHYFAPFPLQIDNVDPSLDYYTRHYLNPFGENSKFIDGGGFLRDRPLPMTPSASAMNYASNNRRLEIQRAILAGIDGWAYDILSLNPSGILAMLNDSASVDPYFSVLLMPDISALNTAIANNQSALVDLLVPLMGQSSVFRHQSKIVICPYAAHLHNSTWWIPVLANLTQRTGLQTFFVPLFPSPSYTQDLVDISGGLTDWGARSPAYARNSYLNLADRVHTTLGRSIYMAPVAIQDMRPKDNIYTEASAITTLRETFRGALNGANWVHLITWNDYSEHTHFSPSLYTQQAFYDMAAFYIQWFKLGSQPLIVRDAIYYFHRSQFVGAPFNTSRQFQNFTIVAGAPALDVIEIAVFAIAPCTVQIITSASVTNFTVSSGNSLNYFNVSLAAGRPRFQMIRSGRIVVDAVSSINVISGTVDTTDLLYKGGSAVSQSPSPSASTGGSPPSSSSGAPSNTAGGSPKGLINISPSTSSSSTVSLRSLAALVIISLISLLAH